MPKPPTPPDLHTRLIPGGYSSVGFIGPDESLNDLLAADDQTVSALGLSHAILAKGLERVIRRCYNLRHRLIMRDVATISARDAYTPTWEPRFGTLPLDHLPSTEVGYLTRNGRHQAFFIQYRGLQDCPWDCTLDNSWSSFDVWLLNRRNGAYLFTGGLLVHLIREHHFYEGHAVPHRLDPAHLARLLERI